MVVERDDLLMDVKDWEVFSSLSSMLFTCLLYCYYYLYKLHLLDNFEDLFFDTLWEHDETILSQ